MKHYSIAIDGPAGAGKSTVARAVAKELTFIYVDTGAMYRAIGLYLSEYFSDTSNVEQIAKKVLNAEISITYENGEQQVLLFGKNVNDQIRTEKAGNLASLFSTIPAVRTKLVQLQQQLAKKESVVMDGRDIGTKVLPNADLKIYLTATTKERAKRRFTELCDKGVSITLDEIEQDIIKRDQLDMNRTESPLCQAADAIYLDCSKLDACEVTKQIIEWFQERKELVAD